MIAGLRQLGCCGCLLMSMLAATVSASNFAVTDAYIRGLPPGQTVTAAFLQLGNQTDADRVLVTVEAPFADRAEIHQHLHHQGMMQMRRVLELPIAARSVQVFQPGGYHIMIFGLRRVLRAEEKLPLVFTFSNGEQLRVMAIVRSVLDE